MLLVAVGLLALWVVISGRLARVEAVWGAIAAPDDAPGGAGGTTGEPSNGLRDWMKERIPGGSPTTKERGTASSPFGGPLPVPLFTVGAI